MKFLFITFVVGALLAVVFIASQILLPLFNNTKLFPAFRSKRRQLERQLTEVNEANDITRLKERLKNAKRLR